MLLVVYLSMVLGRSVVESQGCAAAISRFLGSKSPRTAGQSRWKDDEMNGRVGSRVSD